MPIVSENKESPAFQVLDHALGEDVDIGSRNGLDFPDGLSIASGKRVPLLAAANAALEVATVTIFLEDRAHAGKATGT
ncbi:MAG: hypothetical protein Q8O19_06800 [Rectinemataceae bacterium]|nr:hypothetical protein [Rectinemataceae bacterium]